MQTIDQQTQLIIEKCQKDEAIGAEIYAYMAQHAKDEKNKQLLLQMSQDEAEHAAYWQTITKKDIRAPRIKMFLLKLQTVLLGFTFVLKRLERDEQLAQKSYDKLKEKMPEAAHMLAVEHGHEEEIEAMLDEKRLHYVGSMVLGLNDALVELTGSIAGITFSLANCRVIALTAIITGIAATLSMAASNFLAERAQGSKDALTSSIYTGLAYLITVGILIAPYLLLPNHMYALAFVIMLICVVCIIAAFNYYLSVATDTSFKKHFTEMCGISLSVALISFLIGICAKFLLGVDV